MLAGEGLPFDPIEEAERQWNDRGWHDAAPGMAVVTSVMRVQQLFLASVDAILRPHKLTFARYEVLMLLLFSRSGSLPPSKIGQRLQVHAASVTNAVNRLEQQGLVERLPHPSDGRATLARITPRGRQVATRATDDLNAKAFSSTGLTTPELKALFVGLRKLRRAAGDFD